VNAYANRDFGTDQALLDAIESTVDSIAPSWPLDRMIAVNPYWGRVHQPFYEAGDALSAIAGSSLSLPLAWYRDAWQRGVISSDDLARAAHEVGASPGIDKLLQALDAEHQPSIPAPLLSDTLDGRRDLQHEPAWCDALTHQVAQFCAAYFDREQSDWRPDQARRLYSSWRRALTRDHSISLLMKAPWVATKARGLAEHPEHQIEQALKQLGVASGQWPAYLQAVIMRVSGWAAWCAYLRWQARLAGSDDHTMVDLLAIRLSWECLLDDGKRWDGSVWSRWHESWDKHFSNRDKGQAQARRVWQRAEEIGYQRSLLERLPAPRASATAVAPKVQAAFCIDVRSEVFRRHLEAQSPAIQTLGCAGFFGLPISYTPLGTAATRPQLPGPLAPAFDITDSAGNDLIDKQIAGDREQKLQDILGWRIFQSVPLSAFTLVETLGLGYLGKLVTRSFKGTQPMPDDDRLGLSADSARVVRPRLAHDVAGGIVGQAALARQVLTGMGLSEGLAPLVLLIGHGSQTRNNPQRAGLDCGACCGQTGEVNARALAGLLNNPLLRQQLRDTGLDIPGSTYFLAGLHNTTTDEVQLYDVDEVPASHRARLVEIGSQLDAAGRTARLERAPALGIVGLSDQPKALLKAVQQRANDWSQTRPEWGLANNAAFVVAPRSRTRGVNLEGRCFLHDYDYRRDPDGSLLEQIMTAPMVVTHWINMQYFASTVDNRRYGSGNKTLHNVVGGRLGVFEGNGGDLRIGLAMQSVHDGQRWRHTPLRLTVVIEAPRQAIEAVLDKHETVRQLVTNQWLYLVRLEDESAETYSTGQWRSWQAPAVAAPQ
jgi:uncharacterized protein YbcC (UPF0753/DUF2309 family)